MTPYRSSAKEVVVRKQRSGLNIFWTRFKRKFLRFYIIYVLGLNAPSMMKRHIKRERERLDWLEKKAKWEVSKFKKRHRSK